MRTIFPPTKIFSAVTKLQSCRREDLEAYNFLSGDKILCSVKAILSLHNWRHCVVVEWDLTAEPSQAARNFNRLVPTAFYGTRLRRQNFNLAPTQYRQLRRLSYPSSPFACLRWEQGCKNRKLVITKFSHFLQTFVVVRTWPSWVF